MNKLKNHWMKTCLVGEVALFEVGENDYSQTKFQRNIHVTAFRKGVKISCTNHFSLSHDFKTITPTVRVEVISVDFERRLNPIGEGG